MFWPFRRKKKETPKSIAKKVVVGMIIGGAIGSIVGKKLLDKHSADAGEDDEDENGFTQKDV
jgi:Na+/glutamate symporter